MVHGGPHSSLRAQKSASRSACIDVVTPKTARDCLCEVSEPLSFRVLEAIGRCCCFIATGDGRPDPFAGRGSCQLPRWRKRTKYLRKRSQTKVVLAPTANITMMLFSGLLK